MMFRFGVSAGASILLCLAFGCATKSASGAATAKSEPRWQANGYLSPGRTLDPQIIGQFARKKDCEAAAEEWMQRQVVGNPIFAECLPIDTH